jgi:hypothetical protein
MPHHTTTAEIVKINQLLTEHIRKGDNGLYVYDDGWSDDRVAKGVNPELNRTQVGRIRLELFGSIQPVSPGSIALKDMKSRMEELIARISDLEDLHAKLCIGLSVNKVADVKHLAGRGSVIAKKTA